MEILHHFTCDKCSGWWSIATEFTGQYSDVIEKTEMVLSVVWRTK